MSITDDYDFTIIENTVKDKVIETIGDQIKDLEGEICICQECVIDMVCYCLNRLKPNYSASLYGSLYSKAEAEKQAAEIKEMVEEAIVFVSSNASHEIKF